MSKKNLMTAHDDMRQPERFAVNVVKKLQSAGFEALWAGGCVRDRLLGRHPKDFDVATNATPAEIRQLFGQRRTLAIGEAFGVIAVLGPPKSPIEVATFRKDGTYSDGRHPDSVTFSEAKEDAQRRDFTINGIFYDPITDTVVDYVGGEADLRASIVRAIGRPADRFAEDKLRLVRAVRFATVLDFKLDSATRQAVTAQAADIREVSAERVTAELRRVLSNPFAVRGLRLLVETGLLSALLPESEWTDSSACSTTEFRHAETCLRSLPTPHFSLALATILFYQPAPHDWQRTVRSVCNRWRTTNAEQQLTLDALRHEQALRMADRQQWSTIQPILVQDNAHALVDFAAAVATSRRESLAGVELCRSRLSLPASELDPPAILTGDDLKEMNVPPGAIYKKLLTAVRRAQLDGQIGSRDEARSLACDLLDSRDEQ